MTFSEASLIARDLTRTVSSRVINSGDTSWSTPPGRPISWPIGAGTVSRAIAGQAMLWRSIGAFALVGKHVAALSHYQTKLRDAPPSLDNDQSAAR